MGIFSFFSKEKKETLDKGLSKPIVWMQERLQLCYCPM